jgi:putative ABC transport system permease protein
MTPWDFLESGSRHVKLAARAVRQHRKTSVAAAGILSIGIGMSVAMFSLVDAVLLRPLPFPRQQSIEVIWKVDPAAGRYVEELAYPELRDMQQNIHDFEYVALLPTSLYGYARVLRSGKGDPVQIESAPVSHDFFRVLGVAPMLGRDFNDSDEHVGAPPVVIASHRVWREYLDSDPHIAGRMIRLNGQGYTVIGVMAPGVEFPRGAGFWVPLGIESRVVERRGATFLQAIARVKAGVSHQRVVSEVDGLVQRLAVEYPDAYSRSQRAVVTPLTEYWTGSSRVHLWILLGASALLLAAAVSSAGILIVSGVLGRGSEIATRIALGARSRHIHQQLGAEGALIAVTAATVGTALAGLLIRLSVRLAPADIPRLSEAGLNPASVGFALTTAVFAAVVCTIMPGMCATRAPLDTALREGGTRLSLSRRSLRIRNFFVLAQSAVTVVMLALGGLFLLSYRSMMSADIGFRNRDALTVNLQLRGPGLFATEGLHRHAFYSLLLNRLRDTPGISSAAAVLVRPLEGPIGWERTYEFEFQAGHTDVARLPKANYETITPGYLRTVGTPLLEGRDFTDHDSEESESVAIISRNLADRIRAAGHSPLGHRIRLGNSRDWITVVGVCGDARYRNVTQEDATIFEPYLQAPAPTHYVVVRGNQSAHELGLLVRRTLAGIDPDQAVAGDASIGELIEANTARHRFNMILLLWFAVCATVMAATGIYGVVAETIAGRRREVAIRTALGASRIGIVRGMVSKTLRFALLGEAIGFCAVVPIYGRIAGVLYGVANDSSPLLGVVVIFVSIVSFCASFWPAWSDVNRNSIDFGRL